MDIKLSEQDIKEINTNPSVWAFKQKEGRDQLIEDLSIDYRQGVEDAREEYYQNLRMAYKYLVDKGVIKEGEPAPWQTHTAV